MITLKCFRVTGRPGPGTDKVVDEFELAQVAIECARLLSARGWMDIAVCRVEIDEYEDGENLIDIEWREPPKRDLPKKRRKKVAAC